MPNFLIEKLKKEYPKNDSAVYGTLNKLGYMHGNKETDKGKEVDKLHAAKQESLKAVLDKSKPKE